MALEFLSIGKILGNSQIGAALFFTNYFARHVPFYNSVSASGSGSVCYVPRDVIANQILGRAAQDKNQPEITGRGQYGLGSAGRECNRSRILSCTFSIRRRNESIGLRWDTGLRDLGNEWIEIGSVWSAIIDDTPVINHGSFYRSNYNSG